MRSFSLAKRGPTDNSAAMDTLFESGSEDADDIPVDSEDSAHGDDSTLLAELFPTEELPQLVTDPKERRKSEKRLVKLLSHTISIATTYQSGTSPAPPLPTVELDPPRDTRQSRKAMARLDGGCNTTSNLDS